MPRQPPLVALTLRQLADRTGCSGILFPEPGELVTQEVLAKQLDISSRQIRALVPRGLPEHREGKTPLYPLHHALQWYAVFKVLSDRRHVEYLELAEVRRLTKEFALSEDPDSVVLFPRELFDLLCEGQISVPAAKLRQLDRAVDADR